MKKACIDLLKSFKSTRHFRQIQAQVFTHSLCVNIDVLHMAFATTTDLTYTEKICARVERPTLFIYNVMIKAHAKFDSYRRALFLFDHFHVRRLWPDNYIYPFVFKAIRGFRVVFEGRKIHGFALKTRVLYDYYVCNSVMDMYDKLGCVQGLGKVFDEMPLKDLISWNVLISGFMKSNRFEDAVGVYRRMKRKASMRLDEDTVVSTLSASTALKNLNLDHEIHKYVSTQLGFMMIIRNALLDMYAKCGCLDIARGIFDAMQAKSVICWTSMVLAYMNSGHLEEARSLFERSPVRDLVLWTTMINGYVQFNNIHKAMALLRYMQMNRVKPDKYTLVALLTRCA